MFSNLCILTALSILTASVAVKPIPYLNITQYTGLWYEVYEDLVDRSFQGFGKCITAYYDVISDNNISVFNKEQTRDGSLSSINGYAYYKSDASGGELTVSLDGTPGDAPYWILAVGPVINDIYQYSIVSDNNGLTLFVLARDVSEFFLSYNNTVYSMLIDFGFVTKYNSPLLVEQNECSD